MSADLEAVLQFYLPYCPELLDTRWMVDFDPNGVAHSEPGCATRVTGRGEVPLARLRDRDRVCAACAARSLAAGGAVYNMFFGQLPTLQHLLGVSHDAASAPAPEEAARQLVCTLWRGYNRTVPAAPFRRLQRDVALPRLRAWQPQLRESFAARSAGLLRGSFGVSAPADGEPSVLVALSASDLHFVRRLHDEERLLSMFAAAYAVRSSQRSSVWVLHVPRWDLRVGTILERDVAALDEDLFDTMDLLVSFCDDALRFGGWEPLTAWWDTCRMVCRTPDRSAGRPAR